MGSNPLVQILGCESAGQLKTLCKRIVVTRRDFVDTLEIALSEKSELRARSIGRNFNTVPITPAELEAARNVKPGSDASAINKLFRHLEGQRRLVGHVFWVHGTQAWWLFFFGNREANPMDNHWVGGAHMHMVSWLTHSQTPIETFLNELVQAKRPKLPHVIHIPLDAG